MAPKLSNHSGSAGGAALEIALLLPVVVLLAVGAVDYGRIVSRDIALDGAAYAGAQFGAQSTAASKNTVAIEAVVLDDLGYSADTDEISTNVERYCKCPDDETIDCTTGDCSDGEPPYVYVRVQVDEAFSTLVDYPGLPHEIELSSEAQMRVR